MSAASGTATPADFWSEVRRSFTRRFLEFREEIAVPPTGRPRPKPSPPSIVGTWSGRLWQIGFLEPRTFYPDMQVGITTATRLVDPARMPSEHLPWVYAGERPRVFSKNAFDFDRIIMRYRRREGNFKGTLTGDAELDRLWGIYPYDDKLAPVFHEGSVIRVLKQSATISPKPKSSLPTLAVFGTEATFTLPTASSIDRIPAVISSFEGFGHILDRLESTAGTRPASVAPLGMDLMRDEVGVPFPVARFECPWCHQSTHPRYQANLETEVCEKCGKALYVFR
jgi:hypothetical protein